MEENLWGCQEPQASVPIHSQSRKAQPGRRHAPHQSGPPLLSLSLCIQIRVCISMILYTIIERQKLNSLSSLICFKSLFTLFL